MVRFKEGSKYGTDPREQSSRRKHASSMVTGGEFVTDSADEGHK
jgi:hypothetical protein